MKKIEFEDLLEEIKFIAQKLNKQFNYKFETWELINEAWLSIYDKNFYDKFIFLKRVKWDMFHYIRTKLGLRNKNNINFIHNVYNSETEYTNCLVKEDNSLTLLENKELIDFLLGKLDDKYKSIIKKYFLEEKSLIEVGKELNNITDSVVSRYKTNSIKQLQEELKLLEV